MCGCVTYKGDGGKNKARFRVSGFRARDRHCFGKINKQKIHNKVQFSLDQSEARQAMTII